MPLCLSRTRSPSQPAVRHKNHPVGGQRRALDMDQFAEMAHLIRALQTALIPGKPLHQIKLAVIQAVDLFRPDPSRLRSGPGKPPR